MGYRLMSEADIQAAIATALNSITSKPNADIPLKAAASSPPSSPPGGYFSQTIDNVTSELPAAVIKELKGGFKSYIPMILCTHKACNDSSRSKDSFDASIGMNDKGEIQVKQKNFDPSRDANLSTDEFTEVRENLIRGMRKHLKLGKDTEPGGRVAQACADMFEKFFSAIASRSDFTTDWPFYRGYIIENYRSWVHRRDNSYGLIFNDRIYADHKLKSLYPMFLEQVRHQSNGSSASNSQRGNPTFSQHRFRGQANTSGRGGAAHSSNQSTHFRSNPTSTPLKCYLCSGAHRHKEHQGDAKRLVLNNYGKWVDKAHGNRIVCIAFNVSQRGCKDGPGCSFLHTCSLCGETSHGASMCNA